MKHTDAIIHHKIFSVKYICLALFIMFSYHSKAQSVTVPVTNWNASITAITEAGNNYTGTYASPTNQASINVGLPALLGSVKVYVHYEANPTWNSSLILSAKRTSNGSTLCVGCSISGGTSYITVPLTAVELFRISTILSVTSYTGINIQYQVSGVSVTIPAATYNSRIVFTVSN
ncbi:hypothetical protein NZD88_06805 [Chryseobacterium antibioticum]|uniref:DUF4402 domain-containing protein n=1 Tax=Chryseobacterium pyrolae TaxID=2987481 RepID=A0ABT2IF30_9FLAO|nr:hypothetical protein [Chryseobacterium pyrolae]MCT2407248.1 hypothetical protein [Chryseobacterium pyrolae]